MGIRGFDFARTLAVYIGAGLAVAVLIHVVAASSPAYRALLAGPALQLPPEVRTGR